MRRVQQIMGMPVTIDIENCAEGAVFEAAFERLRQIDARFSTYKPNSEVSRFGTGEIAEKVLHTELKEVIRACRQAEVKTDGYFSAWAAGAFDPSGYVKGWAIAEVGRVIESHGFLTHCVAAGGDVLARSKTDKKWRVGIQDPNDKTKVIRLLNVSNGAVCTSGNYERGAHIINPKTKKPANELLSVTVIGPDIIWTDILATALFAMGKSKAQKFLKTQPDYQALII